MSWLPADLGSERIPGLLQPDLEVRYAFRTRRSQQLEAAAHVGIPSLERHQPPPAGQCREGRCRGAHRHGHAVEPGLSLAEQCFGHRLMMDRVLPGGVIGDLTGKGSKLIHSLLVQIRRRFPELIELYDNTASLQDRTVGTGILSPGLARQYGFTPYFFWQPMIYSSHKTLTADVRLITQPLLESNAQA